MKNIFFALLLSALCGKGQQNLQTVIKLNFEDSAKAKSTEGKRIVTVDDVRVIPTIKLPVFSVFGLANLNQEALKGFNAGGKASMVVRPYIRNTESKDKLNVRALAFFASFNKSASNNDSIVYSKLIFPELGSSSFVGTLQWEKYTVNDVGKVHSRCTFFEIAVKSIVGEYGPKKEKLFFDALNFTLGYRYGYNYIKDNPFENDGKKVNLGFYFSPFISAYNIPDEDKDDYIRIMLQNATLTGNPDDLSDFVFNVGVKTGFHLNGLEFFSDLRHVLGGSKVPIRELKGFHINVGFVFNAEVLNFY